MKEYKQCLIDVYNIIRAIDKTTSDDMRNVIIYIKEIEGVDVKENEPPIHEATFFDQAVNLEVNEQLSLTAWACMIANADGFMSEKEWTFIYKLFKQKLGLNQTLVGERQRSILKKIEVVRRQKLVTL